MSAHDTMRSCLASGLSLGQRIIARFLLLMLAFVVIDPLWECRDHLDNLRHLGGSHAALLIVLLIACAGVMLLRSVHLFALNLLRSIVQALCSPAFSWRVPENVYRASNSSLSLLLPLRI